MPTAVREIEATRLPPELEVPHRYDRALLLVRWHGRPVGQVELRVHRGLIDGETLRHSVVDCAGGQIMQCRLRTYLGLDDPAPAGGSRLAVAVCTRDRPDDLARCLESLAALPDDGQEILVVDSASRSDATQSLVRRHPRIRYVRENRPGLDRARNRALRETDREIVAFTDDDAVVDSGWLRAIASGFSDPRTLAVTGLTLPLELETEAQEWFERTNGFGRGFSRVVHDGTQRDVFFVDRIGAGVNMALRRSVLDLVGPFDDALDAGTPTRSGGDHDMFTRILSAGYCIVYEPTALNWHRHRRGWSELVTAIHGYGVGVYAYLTSQLARGEFRAPVVGLRWLPWQLIGLLRGLLARPGAIRPALAVAELRGCAAGAVAYWRSRRSLRTDSANP